MDSMSHMYCDFEMLKQEILGWELLEKSKIYFFRKKKLSMQILLLFVTYFVLIHLAGGADHHSDVIDFPKKAYI